MIRRWSRATAVVVAGIGLLVLCACGPRLQLPAYDLIVRGGMLYDGSGSPGRQK